MTYIHITQQQTLSSTSSCNMKDVKNDNDIDNNNNMKKKIEMMTKIGLQWYNHMAQPNKNGMKQKILLNHDYNYDIYTLLQSWVTSGIINRNEYNRLVNDDKNTIQQMKYDIIDILPWNTPYNNRINMKTILFNSISNSRNNNNRRNSSIIHNDDIVKSKNNDDNGLENQYDDNKHMIKKTLLLEQQEQEEQTESISCSDDDEDDYDDVYSSYNRLSSLRSSLSLKDYNIRWRKSYRMNDTTDINISDLNEKQYSDKYRQNTSTTIKPKKKVRFLNIK